ncbi:YkvA family protein [Romboutsia sp. 13368]|uniref:YkvA family protein n=1 Tax=Romboutsia sp. 13368 TaxID=2708053 RepID=UPI0025CCB9C8|nr:YkvA family protein [Romboutsia sp. 13368]
MYLKDISRKLKLDLPTLYIALKKKETPVIAKIFAIITVGYTLSPIDLVPDFIPVLGYLDDVILLPMLVWITIKFIPKDILNECRIESQNIWDNGKPKKWYFSIPIILIWILLCVSGKINLVQGGLLWKI